MDYVSYGAQKSSWFFGSTKCGSYGMGRHFLNFMGIHWEILKLFPSVLKGAGQYTLQDLIMHFFSLAPWLFPSQCLRCMLFLWCLNSLMTFLNVSTVKCTSSRVIHIGGWIWNTCNKCIIIIILVHSKMINTFSMGIYSLHQKKDSINLCQRQVLKCQGDYRKTRGCATPTPYFPSAPLRFQYLARQKCILFWGDCRPC